MSEFWKELGKHVHRELQESIKQVQETRRWENHAMRQVERKRPTSEPNKSHNWARTNVKGDDLTHFEGFEYSC